MDDLVQKYIQPYIKQFNLQMETLTPVAIRSGDVYSPLTDYHIENDKFYFIDTDRLSADLIGKQWIDDFERKVEEYTFQGGDENKTPKQKNNFLRDFLKEKGAQIQIQEYLKPNPLKSTLRETDKWVQLRTTIKTNEHAYIPGSSIKGAIKTAVIYCWLTETDEGKHDLDVFVEGIKEKVNSNAKKIVDFKKNKHLLKKDKSDDELKEIAWKLSEINIKIQSLYQDLAKDLDHFEKNISTKIFGTTTTKNLYDSSTRFKILDTQLLSDKNLFIGMLNKRYRADDKLLDGKKKDFSPSLQEFIGKDTTTSFQITIPQFKLDWEKIDENGYFAQMLWDEKGLKKILSAINQFSHDYLDYEIEKLNGFETFNEGECFRKSNLDSLLQQFTELQKLNLKPNESIMCLGFGKSYFANTVTLALRKAFPEEFVNMIKILTKNRHPRAKEFPFSYYCVAIQDRDYPLGWVRIVETKKSYTKEEFESGIPILGTIVKLDKPHSRVMIVIEGIEEEYNVIGKDKYEKSKSDLIEGKECLVYRHSNRNVSFNPQ